jgi:hypothetical protein
MMDINKLKMSAVGVRRGKAAFSQWVKVPPGYLTQKLILVTSP